MAVSKNISERISAQVKRYQKILTEAKNRDVNETDTVVIIHEMLSEILGYNKFSEITREFAIRGTFVDLAVKVSDNIRFLVEAKAIGVDLKDSHVKQAIDYGANNGIEWVILSNGATWRVYKIHFRQPIDKSLVFVLDLLQLSPRDSQIIDCFGNLSREGFTKSSMAALFQQQQATSKFALAGILVSDPMLSALRREVRKRFPGIRVEEDFLRTILENEILKREVVESDEAKQAASLIKKAARSAAKAKERSLDAVENQPQSSQSSRTAAVTGGGGSVEASGDPAH